jgi:phosphoglycerate dehydrogenase-like enzyme
MSDGSSEQSRVWTNTNFPEDVLQILEEGLDTAELVYATQTFSGNLVSSPPDSSLEEATIAFGQPDAEQLLQLTNIRWVHLTSAGYTKYDRDDLRAVFRERGAILTNSSSVYAEPCAQHAMSMILAFARQLPMSWKEQFTSRAWSDAQIRRQSVLLNDQNIIIYGYGAIAHRLTELLKPFGVNIVGVRRKASGNESIPMVSLEDHKSWLEHADHVINILPANDATKGFFDRDTLRGLKKTAYFYNIGRGVTVDQDALVEMLNRGEIAGAYLDVTDPEPLPVDHPLWVAPNCFVTPHTAGGFQGEMERLVSHFLGNYVRFEAGQELIDRVY